MIIYYKDLIDKYFDKVEKGVATQKEVNRLIKLEEWQLNSLKK